MQGACLKDVGQFILLQDGVTVADKMLLRRCVAWLLLAWLLPLLPIFFQTHEARNPRMAVSDSKQCTRRIFTTPDAFAAVSKNWDRDSRAV